MTTEILLDQISVLERVDARKILILTKDGQRYVFEFETPEIREQWYAAFMEIRKK